MKTNYKTILEKNYSKIENELNEVSLNKLSEISFLLSCLQEKINVLHELKRQENFRNYLIKLVSNKKRRELYSEFFQKYTILYNMNKTEIDNLYNIHIKTLKRI